MGIHGLMKLLSEECPKAIKEHELENYTGRKVAIDASMAMYQFLVAVRSGGEGGSNMASMMLTNEAGEVTSHIQGMFNRTIKMMTSGIKPIYIFDGKPPQMKGGELAKRIAKREKAETDLAAAKEAGDADEVDKFSRRLVKVTKQHNEDCKELLRLMGVPVMTAPCEAEAQCAELAKKGKVYGVATEDMDALTFRTPKLLRKLTFSQGKDKQPIIEIDFEQAMAGLDLTYEQFVDLCIMCGCDYCSSIKGIGPKTALKLIKQYKNIETIVKVLQKDKKTKNQLSSEWFPQRVLKEEFAKKEEEVTAEEKKEADESQVETPGEKQDETNELDANEDGEQTEEIDVTQLDDKALDDNDKTVTETLEEEGDEKYDIIPPIYAQARQLFLNAEVIPADDIELKWNEPDEAGLKTFLIERMCFNADRVNAGIKRLQEAQQKKAQKRLDSFFTAVATTSSSTTNNTSNKRKADEKTTAAKGKGKMIKKR